jgi:hypothetical protein
MSEARNKDGPRNVGSADRPMIAIATEIQVLRRVRGGWHVYTCELLPGLYVASRDDKAAYNDVPTAITMLFKLDFGVRISVHHKTDYDTFMSRIEIGERALDALNERTREMMETHQSVLSFLIGSTTDDLAAGHH